MNNKKILATAITLAHCTFFSLPVWAASGSITQVVLYEGNAQITRQLPIVGNNTVVFGCLPASINTDSIQVATNNSAAAVNIGEITLKTTTKKDNPYCSNTGYDQQIQTLKLQQAQLEAQLVGIKNVDQYLQQLPNHSSNAPSTGQQVASVLYTVAQKTEQNEIKRYQTEQALQAVRLKINNLQEQIGDDNQQQVYNVSIDVNAPSNTSNSNLLLTYNVDGPTWQPSYKAVLNTSQNQVNLLRQAKISQNTGENWQNVPLIIATGTANKRTDAPLPQPWVVDLYDPSVSVMRSKVMMAMPAPAMAMVSEAQADRSISKSRLTIKQVDNTYNTFFELSRPVSVAANNSEVAVTLSQTNLPAKVLLRTSPAVDAKAYIFTTITKPDGTWPAGEVTLFRDNALVGKSQLTDDASLEQTLGFGVDSKVKIKATSRKELNTPKLGLLGNMQEKIYSQTFSITNEHNTPVQLQVLANSPVVQNSAIELKSTYNIAPTQTNFEDTEGLVMWDLTLPAKASQNINMQYNLRYDKDKTLINR